MTRFVLWGVAAVFFLSAPMATALEENFEYWPGAQYDPAIPTVEEVLGYASGDRITWHADVIKYFEALAAAAPDRVQIRDYGTTWEGRRLIYVIIGSPENMARLDEISAGMKSLADPRTISRDEAENLVHTLPGSLWMAYSVHGNEISSTDAAMMTAYHLLAVEGDERIDKILENTIIFLDPLQNPDGRDRFIHNFEQAEGLAEDSSQLAAEHNEPWPFGRTNHYLFDLNRDWFALTQPETIGIVAALQEWYPLVFVDAHEMGSDSSYYFAPEAIPYNPHLAEDQRASLELFGRNNARWFDAFGFDYFTREVFDAFYPGYGASWPSYYGSIAMTYEQASARGLKMRRSDGGEFHFRDTVRHHFVTSLSTAEVVARNREKFLQDFYDYRLSAIEEGGKEDIRAYIIPTQNDQSLADKLAGLLAFQGVEIIEAAGDFRACGVAYGAGSYVINLAQPAKRLIRTLMDVDVPMEADFLAEQERLRAKDLPDEIYDVTAWSLPLMYNLRADSCGRVVKVEGALVAKNHRKSGSLTGAGASVSYLVDWGSTASARLLTAALRARLRVRSVQKAFVHDGHPYAAGTLVFPVDDNPTDLVAILEGFARETGAHVVGVSTSWVTEGPNFGSGNAVTMPAPRIAIAWGEGTDIYAPGNIRYVIERRYGYPVTAIRTSQLATANLARFDVLILPPGGFGAANYEQVLGAGGGENIKAWVEAGGTLIGISSALRYLASPEIDLLSSRREKAAREREADNGVRQNGKPESEEAEPALVEGTIIENEEAYRTAIASDESPPDSVAGVLVRASVDPDHWLGNGLAETLHVLVRGSDIYRPLALDEGTNVVRFDGADDLLASGYMWQENRDQLAFKPFVMVQPRGRGLVIGFTQDPTVRAYLDGLDLVLVNAVFRGAANASPVR